MLSMESKWDDLLKRIIIDNPEINDALIASTKGFPLALFLPEGVDKRNMSAIAASFFSLAEQSNMEIDHGKFKLLCVKDSEGYIFIRQVESDALLVISVQEDISSRLMDFSY